MINRIKVFIKKSIGFFEYLTKKKRVDFIIIDTPTHGNLGDHAIVQSMKMLLNGKKIHEITAANIDGLEWLYSKVTPKDIHLLIPGGGFLGDLWPDEEARVQRIISCFKDNPITVFPQTIFYQNSENNSLLESARSVYKNHPNLEVYVRDENSFKFARENYDGVICRLVPDVVLTLKYKETYKRRNIGLCFRNDKEKNILEEDIVTLQNEIEKSIGGLKISRLDTVIDNNVYPDDRDEEIQKKLREFAECKLIITDRLHGMIFATITNTPCIALGNVSGKVKGVYQWIQENEYIRYADSIKEVNTLLCSMDLNKEYRFNQEEVLKKFETLFVRLGINHG